MGPFTGYWTAYPTEEEAKCAQKAEWSQEALTRGIARRALEGLVGMVAPGAVAALAPVDRLSGMIAATGVFEHAFCRMSFVAVEDGNAAVCAIAAEVIDRSRESLCLCVLPSSQMTLWTHVIETWPERMASVVPLTPVDMDAIADGRASLMDLVEFKLFRRLALGAPDAGSQFDQHVFSEFLATRRGSSARFEDLGGVLAAGADDQRRWVDHPLVGRVRTTLEHGRACLLVGPSSSGKSVLAVQVGRSFVLSGKRVGYLNLGQLDSGAPSLLRAILPNDRRNCFAILVLDDLQSNPSTAQYLLALSSVARRASTIAPPVVLAVTWVDFSADVVRWIDDCLPVVVRPGQISSRLAGEYRETISNSEVEEVLRRFGDDIYLLRLSLDESRVRGQLVGPRELAESVWHSRTEDAGVSDDDSRRVGLIAASLGQYDISITPGFLAHEARVDTACLQALQRSGLLRRYQANLSIGHRSLCALLTDWLGEGLTWTQLDRLGGPRGTGEVVLNYLRSLGSSLAVDSLRALAARAGFKDKPRLNSRAAALVELWDAFGAVLDRIEYQQEMDPTWGRTPSSAMFAVAALAEVGRSDIALGSLQFLRSCSRLDRGRMVVTTEGLSTTDDFEQIRGTMQQEDEVLKEAPVPGWVRAQDLDSERFHRTWISGLVLCAEAAAQDPGVSLKDLAAAVESEQLPNGSFYPSRVPWCTARVIIGLAACGRTIHTSQAVSRAVAWLLRERADDGACTGGLWKSGTGSWNSTLETTGMVLLALSSAGWDCSDPRLETARAFLLSQRNRWTNPGKELDGALAVQAFLDTGGTWEEVAAETHALSRWAKGELLWQGALRSAKESRDQSCRVAQIASYLIAIGWTAIKMDLPGFLDALATPSLSRRLTEDVDGSRDGKRPTAKLTEVQPAEVAVDPEFDSLKRLERISLEACTVVGDYRRFDERVRNELRDWRERISAPLIRPTLERENFLIWAAPGSGKTFFVQEIARILGDGVLYVELNLARQSKSEFCDGLSRVRACTGPVLCLLDEIDARSEETWPYEECFSYLDLNLTDGRSVVMVLIGSSGSGKQGMIQGILKRCKGQDMMDRIPEGKRLEIPSLSIEDKAVVVATHVVAAAATSGRAIREVEKLALFFALRNPELRTPRQLRELSVGAVGRVSASDDRLKYDDLFARGDNRDKTFWTENLKAAAEFSNTFVRVEK